MTVRRTYVQMTRPDELRGAEAPPLRSAVTRLAPNAVALYRHLYAEVGRMWRWLDRLPWTDEQIAAHLGRPDIEVSVLLLEEPPARPEDGILGQTVAGYFELQRHGDGSVEIAYFGLVPHQRRRGLGRYLLTVAVESAWARGAARVWLHTCTLDDPAALPNYLARGFQPFQEEEYEETRAGDQESSRPAGAGGSA